MKYGCSRFLCLRMTNRSGRLVWAAESEHGRVEFIRAEGNCSISSPLLNGKVKPGRIARPEVYLK